MMMFYLHGWRFLIHTVDVSICASIFCTSMHHLGHLGQTWSVTCNVGISVNTGCRVELFTMHHLCHLYFFTKQLVVHQTTHTAVHYNQTLTTTAIKNGRGQIANTCATLIVITLRSQTIHSELPFLVTKVRFKINFSIFHNILIPFISIYNS